MPKKKLTSRQVAKLMKRNQIYGSLNCLKINSHMEVKSFVPLSPTNILKNFTEPLGKAFARIK